jgi:hypothetical protein
VLEAARGEHCAQLSTGIDKHCSAGGGINRLPEDLADITAVAHVRTNGADTNDIIGCGDHSAGNKAQRDIAVACCGERISKRTRTDGRVAAASRVANERTITVGCVVVTRGIAK